MNEKCKNCRYYQFYIHTGHVCINVDSSYRNEVMHGDDWCGKWQEKVGKKKKKNFEKSY